MASGDTHRLIVSSIRELVLLYRCSPQLILDSLLGRNHLPPRGRPHERFVRRAEVCHQSGIDNARMDGRGRDLRVAPCDLGRIQDIGKLGLAVADPVANHGGLLRGAHIGEVDAFAWVALDPRDVLETMRTLAPGSSSVLSIIGRSSLMRRAWPMWLVPNWIL